MPRERPSIETVIGLYVDEGLTLAETGDRFGYSTSWVAGQLRAAGVRLRQPGSAPGYRRIDVGAEAELVADISELYGQGLSMDAIGERYGRSAWWVRQRLDRAGVAPRDPGGLPGPPVDAELLGEMIRLYVDDGLTTGQVGERIGRSKAWVGRRLRRAGVALARPQRRRVDPEVVRRLYVDDEMSLAAVAERVEASEPVVRRVLADAGVAIRAQSASAIRCGDLARLYLDEGLATPAIAERLGVSTTGVSAALRRCGIPVRPVGTELSIPTADLGGLLDAGLSDADIAQRYGVAVWAVRRRLRAEGIRRPPAKPPWTRHPPPAGELRALYVEGGATQTEIATHYRVPHTTVRRWLSAAGIERPANPGTAGTGRRAELTPELLWDLYVDREWTAAEIGRHVGVSAKIVLTHLHSHGVPVRPSGARRPARPPVLDQLYDDADVVVVLERHGVAVAHLTGTPRERFPEPVPLTAGLVAELYVTVGLSTSHISLLTGHQEPAVRTALQEAGIPTRPGLVASPWTQRQRP